MSGPDIEPLSDIEWQRVERGLFTALDRESAVPAVPEPRRRRAWGRIGLIAGGVALAASAALALVVARPEAPKSHPDQRNQPTRVVAKDAPTEVSFGESTITLDAGAAATMSGDAEHGVLIQLERGRATFEVATRGNRPNYLVQAGDVTVRVIGTQFSVFRSGDAARVDVTRGHVEVVARGHRAQVLAGESWSSDGDWEAVVGGSKATTTGGIAAAPLSPPDAQAPPQQPQPPPAPVVKKPKVDDRARFEAAAALEPTDPAAAIAAYKVIAKGSSRWAANALFAAARLAFDTHDAQAGSLLREYVRRFPAGASAADAKSLLQQL
jgi:hypothetical protein